MILNYPMILNYNKILNCTTILKPAYFLLLSTFSAKL